MQTPEKPRCAAEVMLSWRVRACGMNAAVQRNGVWYCKKHDPQRIAAREAASEAKWRASVEKASRQARIQAARDKVVEAATLYAQKYNNTRTVSNKEWAEEVRTAFMQLEEALRELEETSK